MSGIQDFSEGDIAIVGVGLKFPNANNLEELYINLKEKIEFISECPPNRKKLILDNLKDLEKESIKFPKAAFLEDIVGFDNELFNISPKEAKLMDPIQRITLEVCYSALDDGGYTSGKEQNIGVFIGCPTEYSRNSYQNLIMKYSTELANDSFSENLPAVISSRISYFLDLHGPSMLIDTSCSSSLIAFDVAIKYILSDSCKMALVGGVNIMVDPSINSIVDSIGILSSDGKTKSYDDSNSGVGQGEGCGIVLIKKLSDAIKDKDHIYSVIKAIEVNQDGKSIGITAPRKSAQVDVIKRTWDKANIDPNDIGFIEGHGTATKLGDLTKIGALKSAFLSYTNRRQFCALGSVKSNYGHTVGAAGVLGVLKCILSLNKKTIFPNSNLDIPNRRVDFIQSPLYISSDLEKWISSSPLICGVSSFGISGTNCHMILQEWDNERYVDSINCMYPILLSGRNNQEVLASLKKLRSYIINKNIRLEDVSYSLCTRKKRFTNKLILTANSLDSLLSKIENILKICSINSNNITKFDEYKLLQKNSGSDQAILAMLNDPYFQLPCWINSQNIPISLYSYEKKNFWFKEISSNQDFYHIISLEKRNINNQVNDIMSRVMIISEKNFLVNVIKSQLKKDAIIFNSKFRIKDDVLITGNKRIYLNDNDIIIYPVNVENSTMTYTTEKQIICKFINIIQEIYKITKKVKLIFIGIKSMEDCKIDPLLNSMYSFLKTFKWEKTNINCKCIDYSFNCSVDMLINNINEKDNYFISILRNNNRYIETIKNIKTELAKGSIGFKKTGTYVIFGGLGRIGVNITRFLVTKFDAKVIVLTHRNITEYERNLRSDDKQFIKEFLDTNIEIKKCNIKEYLEINKIFSDILKYNKTIDGIFHCSVNDKNNFINELRLEDLIESYEVKVNGARNIYEAVKNNENKIGFVVLFSSVMTLISGNCNASYSMVNSYLDSLVYFFNKNLNQQHFVVLNWSEWENIGLTEELKNEENKSLFHKIDVKVAINLMEEALKKYYGFERIIIGKENDNSKLYQLKDYIPIKFYKDLPDDTILVSAQDNEDLKLAKSDKSTSIEVYNKNINNIIMENKLNIELIGREDKKFTKNEMIIAESYSKIMGYQSIDINKKFIEMGGDSIFAFKISFDLSEHGVNLDANKILKYQTIKEMGKYLENEETTRR